MTIKIGNHEFEVKNGLISFTPEEMEDFLDVLAFDEAMALNEEAFPLELIKSIHNGENPVRAYRKYRGLTQGDLGAQVGVTQAMIADIESGKRDGSVKTMKAIAAVLGVDLDDLV